MPELGFHDQKQLRPAECRGRDVSPDSLIYSVESNNFSLFSSASGSVERCSSASDVHDRDSLSSSDISAHLSGHGFREGLRGPDPDLSHSTAHKNGHLTKKVEKAKAQNGFLEAEETEDENQALDSARSSFSQAIKECQNRKTRSKIILKKPDRRRPASLDLNNHVINITSFSPRLGVKMKNSVSAWRTSTFPSPGTPNYRPPSIGVQRGWSSERVPMHTNANRRHLTTALLPYSNNGRALPSKWEDAERWILSPISGDGAMRQSLPQPQRRPKSKSGPLGPPGTAHYNMYSPAFPMFEERNAGNSMAASPFSARVISADSLSTQCLDGQRGGGNFPSLNEPCMARSVSVHGCSELLNQLSLLGFQDGAMRQSLPQPQRRPKSKSGPLGPPGTAHYNMYSPAFPMFEERNAGNSMAASPFSARVISADSLSTQCLDGQRGGGNFPSLNEPCMARSVSVHGCSELLNQLSLLGFQDDKLDGVMDAATNISRDVSRRDMATQMSPDGSPYSSPRGRPSSSTSNSLVPFGELQCFHSSKAEIRDVEVDDQVTMTRWSKKNKARTPGGGSELTDDWKRKTMEVRSASWEVSETTKSLSKIKREEARITAWENLQKAKAEAKIRKLEMKLEKKRSSSMDKIMNKLRSAQRKAQEMRGSVLADEAPQAPRTSHKALSLRRTHPIGSLSGCFTCHAS